MEFSPNWKTILRPTFDLNKRSLFDFLWFNYEKMIPGHLVTRNLYFSDHIYWVSLSPLTIRVLYGGGDTTGHRSNCVQVSLKKCAKFPNFWKHASYVLNSYTIFFGLRVFKGLILKNAPFRVCNICFYTWTLCIECS